MTERHTEAAREALAATVAGVLRQHARQSVHPADQAALRRTAGQIAIALQAEFRVLARRAVTTEAIDGEALGEAVHE